MIVTWNLGCWNHYEGAMKIAKSLLFKYFDLISSASHMNINGKELKWDFEIIVLHYMEKKLADPLPHVIDRYNCRAPKGEAYMKSLFTRGLL